VSRLPARKKIRELRALCRSEAQRFLGNLLKRGVHGATIAANRQGFNLCCSVGKRATGAGLLALATPPIAARQIRDFPLHASTQGQRV
jgi:hypothetical protein